MKPFSGIRIDEFTTQETRRVGNEIASLKNEEFLKVSLDEFTKNFIERFEVKPLFLHPEKGRLGKSRPTEIQIYRNSFNGPISIPEPATEFDWIIPYSGDKRLWDVRPKQGIGHCEITVEDQVVILTGQFPDVAPNRLKEDIDACVAKLQASIDAQLDDIEKHNLAIVNVICDALQKKQDSALEAMQALDRLKGTIK